jgi:hypothetical protein
MPQIFRYDKYDLICFSVMGIINAPGENHPARSVHYTLLFLL